MMIGRILLAVSILAAIPSARAAWEVGGGVEDYRWVEYPVGTAANPRENGPRLALFADWTQDGDQGGLFAWRAKLYGGTVHYDTYVISTGAPFSTKTDYTGAVSEGQTFYRDDLGDYRLDYLGGLGLDAWRRSIHTTGGHQTEDYLILFARAGLRFAKSAGEPGFHGEFGIKYPFWTKENAYLDSAGYTSNPKISPKGLVSGYAELGYRINATFDVLGYYDSWRFARSADVMAMDTSGATWLIHQPKSSMDALGIKLLVSF